MTEKEDAIMPVDFDLPDIDLSGLPAFDVSSLNLVELGRQLKANLDAKRSKWVFLKIRQNEKAILDEEYQQALIAQIEDLRDMNSALLNLNAEIYLTRERMQRIIQRYREHENFLDAEGRRISEMAAKRHAADMLAIEDESVERALRIRSLDLENQLREAQLAQIQAATEILTSKATAEIEHMNATTKGVSNASLEILARAEFIKKALESIDISELPAALQTYITSSIFNPHGTQFHDFDMQEQIKKFLIEKEEAQARKERAEAREKESQADISRTTADKTMLDFDLLRKAKETKNE